MPPAPSPATACHRANSSPPNGEELRRYGVEVIGDRVVEIEPGFSVWLRAGEVLTARRILIATGAGDELPDISGARERWGRDVLHCPYCHGWEVATARSAFYRPRSSGADQPVDPDQAKQVG